MYPGMPYPGGMGPYSGWLPSVPNIPTNFTGDPPMGVNSAGYPIGGQVPGAPTGPGAAPAAATPANPYGANSGWLPPAAGTQQDWGGPGQPAMPGGPASIPGAGYQPTQSTVGLTGSQYDQFGNPTVNPYGPNSGWLPPAPGTQQDWGGPGQPAMPTGWGT
jgi:hypothetical protein